MYHWNMSLRYHDIVLHLKNLQNPHLDEKISSIFWWFTLTIETYNDFLEKKNSGPSSNASIFYIWSFSCFRFFGFFMLVQMLAQVHRFKVSITSISNGGWNPAIGRREISIFVQPSFFWKPLWARRSIQSQGPLLAIMFTAWALFWIWMRYSLGNRFRQKKCWGIVWKTGGSSCGLWTKSQLSDFFLQLYILIYEEIVEHWPSPSYPTHTGITVSRGEPGCSKLRRMKWIHLWYGHQWWLG